MQHNFEDFFSLNCQKALKEINKHQSKWQTEKYCNINLDHSLLQTFGHWSPGGIVWF